MHFMNIIVPAIAALSATTTAAPASKRYTWSVSHFELGCSPGGCIAESHIKAPKHGHIPSFEAKCSATSYDKHFVKCKENKNVSFRWAYPDDTDSEKMVVHYKYESKGKTYEVSKKIHSPSPDKSVSFKLKPKRH